jgi:lactoylglutathione lyase
VSGFTEGQPPLTTLTSTALLGVAVASLLTTFSRAKNEPVDLGNFSVSLTVEDIRVSKAFYEKLGFEQVGGVLEQNWVVMKNDTTKIGLFQGMFEKNSLTFNPGWNSERETPEDFQDVRELQRILKERGLELTAEADPDSDGPAYFTLVDPDGNPILVDQHVPRPKR